MQKFQIRGWTLVMIWIVTAGFIWFFSSVWPALNGWLKEQQHLSGWAQAAGVIITVAVGFLTIQHQIRAAQELEAEKRRRDFLLRTEIVYTLLGNVLDAIDGAERGLFVQPLIDISGRVGALDRAAAALEGLPPLEIPGPGVAIEVVQLPAKVRRLAKHVGRVHEALAEIRKSQTLYTSADPLNPPGRTKMQYESARDDAREACKGAMRICEAQSGSLRAQLG